MQHFFGSFFSSLKRLLGNWFVAYLGLLFFSSFFIHQFCLFWDFNFVQLSILQFSRIFSLIQCSLVQFSLVCRIFLVVFSSLLKQLLDNWFVAYPGLFIFFLFISFICFGIVSLVQLGLVQFSGIFSLIQFNLVQFSMQDIFVVFSSSLKRLLGNWFVAYLGLFFLFFFIHQFCLFWDLQFCLVEFSLVQWDLQFSLV